uniref:hypothetical protein n=1 Tax=Lietzensia polymorpha TaxID=2962110 RepID=UPI002181FD46|nr:hypothetical protein N4K72_pgp078 [Lietzensia polymorpha]UVI61259.1 hypothetical protein [Lietzensia polymorpha]
MMNNQKFEKYKLTTKYHISSYFLEDKHVIKCVSYKIPLLFNLYENRLIHSEFLKDVFAELLENKEILRYNFQNKIFSLFNSNKNIYILNISLFQRAKIIIVTTLVILLIRSFPYRLVFQENKNFFRLYGLTILNIIRSPFSMAVLIVDKLLRKLRFYSYILSKKIKFVFLNMYTNLFLNYLQYKSISQLLMLNSQNYINLFTNLEIIELLKFYNSFSILWVSIFLKEAILVNRVLKRFNSKPENS